MSVWQRLKRELVRWWLDPASIYSEHGREGI